MIGVSRAHDNRRIRSAAGTPNGKDRDIRRDETAVRCHHGDFYADLHTLTEKAQGVGNYLHRANASEFSGDTPFRSAEGMGGGIYQEPFFMQLLDSFVGQFVFSWFFEPICVWNTDNGYPFQRGETLGSISGSGG